MVLDGSWCVTQYKGVRGEEHRLLKDNKVDGNSCINLFLSCGSSLLHYNLFEVY
jgi:hypothetical protein